jgi:hypothetical protein
MKTATWTVLLPSVVSVCRQMVRPTPPHPYSLLLSANPPPPTMQCSQWTVAKLPNYISKSLYNWAFPPQKTVITVTSRLPALTSHICNKAIVNFTALEVTSSQHDRGTQYTGWGSRGFPQSLQANDRTVHRHTPHSKFFHLPLHYVNSLVAKASLNSKRTDQLNILNQGSWFPPGSCGRGYMDQVDADNKTVKIRVNWYIREITGSHRGEYKREWLFALMTEAASTDKKSVNFHQTTRRKNPDGSQPAS